MIYTNFQDVVDNNIKYTIIYCDPPWSYYNDKDATPNVTTKVGFRRPPYPVLGSDTIKKFRINDITAENSILFIWTTDYHLEKCISIINYWGFNYKTIGFVWQKLQRGGRPVSFMGAYTLKSGIELCLLATKGKMIHRFISVYNVPSFISSKRSSHSSKPEEVRDRIDKLFANFQYRRIELFARKETPGWDCFGNEIIKCNKIDFSLYEQ